VSKTGSARASLQDKEVIIVQDSRDEATFAPIGGGGAQVAAEQMTVSSRRRLAQPGRDTAGGGPIRLRHNRVQFPVQVWRRRPGQIQQDKKTLTLSATGRPWRRCQRRRTGWGTFHARTADDTQRADDRLNLGDGRLGRVHLAPQPWN
jgi:hypothetical protein